MMKENLHEKNNMECSVGITLNHGKVPIFVSFLLECHRNCKLFIIYWGVVGMKLGAHEVNMFFFMCEDATWQTTSGKSLAL